MYKNKNISIINETPELKTPEDMLCSITELIMTDPVMLVASGNTYEREAILGWLSKHDTDPLTNKKITDKTIVPNLMAKRMIVSFLEEHKKTNPEIMHETYLPGPLVQELIT